MSALYRLKAYFAWFGEDMDAYPDYDDESGYYDDRRGYPESPRGRAGAAGTPPSGPTQPPTPDAIPERALQEAPAARVRGRPSCPPRRRLRRLAGAAGHH